MSAASLYLTSCARPPATAYIGGKNAANVALGTNSAGEACTQSASADAEQTDILCGSWDQPAARVVSGGSATPADLPTLVSTSSWRAGLERSVACIGQPKQAEVLGAPALLLACTRRLGGWPHVAVATVIGGRAYFADGVSSSLPVMERSIGVESGLLKGQSVSQHHISAGLAAQRLAASALSASDLGRAETSLGTAASANRAGNYAEAEAAYASVAALQKRVLGPRNPGLARTLAGQAVQASNLGRYNEAERLLNQAEVLAGSSNQTDENALPLVWHDRGIEMLDEHKYSDALVQLRRSEAGYRVNLHGAPLIPARENFTSTGRHTMALRDLFTDPAQTTAVVGIVENERDAAVALRRLDRLPESQQAALTATQIAQANDLDAPDMQARLLRTSAFVSEARGLHESALTELASSSKDFGVAFPGSPAYGRTALLLAGRQAEAGDAKGGLATCRTAIGALREANLGIDPALLMPCLKLLNDTATDATADTVHQEMFEAAELAQGSVTSQQIAEAAARLSENARDPRVSALIKQRADLKAHLSDLLTEQQEQLPPPSEGVTREAPASKVDHTLDAEIAKTQAALAESNSALQAASPNFGALVQEVVTTRDLAAALRPGEVFCSIMLAPDGGWSFLIAGGKVSVAPINGGSAHVAELVQHVRASLDTETMPPPPFDIASAQELYQLLLGSFTPQLKEASALTVAPTGPLLSLPFGLLLSGPATQDSLATAPWLVQHLVVAHVPAPANLVSLRKIAIAARDTTPWFGFGDFRPVTRAQALAAFPPASCGDSAALLAGLPPLPGAQIELETVRKITHADAADQLLGPAFTAQAVLHAKLKHARILHFATHGLLSTDLKCQTEPALVTSAPANAPSAESALLSASQVTQLDLDAQTVILSACNTGGSAGGAGESLSGLARSFFYAGAHSMLVTHWAVNDRVTAYLVALAVAEAQHDPALGIAGGLAAAQRKMLSDATGALAGEAHPFYWAPLAVIGDGHASLGEAPPA